MIINDQREFLEWVDRYLRNELQEKERSLFIQFCEDHPKYAQQLEIHKELVAALKYNVNRQKFIDEVSAFSNEYHANRKPVLAKKRETAIIALWNRLRVNATVAAVIAVASVFSTLWLTGYYSTIKKTTSDYSALRRDVNNVKRNVNAQNAAIKSINKENITSNTEVQYGATGFMVTKEGYVATNYHVITGADSVLLQNHKGETFRARIVHADPGKDIAILHIDDDHFKRTKDVPYTFKSESTDLGEDIYTLGFPRDEAVYGQGYLSSATGYGGDSIAYQISIPVNPGNSGGPVLDSKGNVIGIISGKQTGIDGAGFAIKTKVLLDALSEIPLDSLEGDIVLNKKNALYNLSRTEQIKQLQDYIYIVKVF